MGTVHCPLFLSPLHCVLDDHPLSAEGMTMASVCVCVCVHVHICVYFRACKKLYKAAWSRGYARLDSQVLEIQRKETGIPTEGLLEGFLEAAAWNSAYENVAF